NNGELAYQSVFHSHFHLIPRYTKDDGFSMTFTDNTDKYSSEELQKIQKQITDRLGD
ncbi:HIT family protein, partial [Enterococcus faecium]|nr:HIT family protein [Enterococcus faecium]